MPTLEEIARLAQVSRSTVSRVINNDPNVSPDTRQRVTEVIRELNFHPNRAARSLAGGRTHVLGLVIPRAIISFFHDPFFPLLLQGVTSACNARDYSVMLWLAEPGDEHRMVQQVLGIGLIDGILITSVLVNDQIVNRLNASKLPFVVIGRYPDLECACYVNVDNINSAREAVSYLLRLRRKRVATITGPLGLYEGLDRRDGYLAALKDRGLPVDPHLVVEGDFTEDGGYQSALRLLPHKPDAIFAASDMMAVGALRAIQEVGLRVPEDIALIGFDDLPIVSRTQPPLTTVRQPIPQLGSAATEMLIDLIEHPTDQPRRVILPTELIIRKSCGSSR
ncbi:MAG: LacI family DNA-binding transcriptional regulator [Anaerolineales bacterium]|nr:LacI family DNA-binding transcriptional regulator [Anaerolineales bacterium]